MEVLLPVLALGWALPVWFLPRLIAWLVTLVLPDAADANQTQPTRWAAAIGSACVAGAAADALLLIQAPSFAKESEVVRSVGTFFSIACYLLVTIPMVAVFVLQVAGAKGPVLNDRVWFLSIVHSAIVAIVAYRIATP